MGIRQELWLQEMARANADYYMPHASYVLSATERKEFVGIISNIRTPTNYVGFIHKRLTHGKLQYMKTHDYHVLMQQVPGTLPLGEVHYSLFYTLKRELYNVRDCAVLDISKK